MNYSFEAKHAFVQDDDYMLMIGFADDEAEPSQYILLQRSLNYDAQDKELGMDKTHIQVEDESRGLYGGIESAKVNDEELRIKLTPQGQDALGVKGELVISLKCEKSTGSEVIKQFRKLAEGKFPVEFNAH